MANKRLNATITIGGAITGALRGALGSTRDGLNQIGKAVTDLKQRQKELNGVVAGQARLGRAASPLKVHYATQELGLINRQIEALRKKQRIIDQSYRGMSLGKSQMAGAGLMLGATTAAAASAFLPVMQAAAFEKAMLGVAKQVEGARDESGRLTAVYFDMARQIQLLSRETPMATSEIADMVAAGARMGIARDELIQFTRTASQMSSAFDLPAGELAEQMGKIATLFKIPIPRIGELADVINTLDDNAISKGGDIIEVMKRMGGAASFVKMPAREAAALASTFLSLGASAEIAATASNAAMRELSISTMQPKRFQAGLAAIGMDAKKVQKDMSKDATGTIGKVLDALNELPDEKRLTVATQLFGKEYGDDLAKLAARVEEYRRQLALARSGKAMGRMLREHEARLQTTSAQWEVAKNRISELGVNIGSVLLPPLNQLMGVVGAATSVLADFTREHPLLTANIARLAGALLGSLAAWSAVRFGLGAVTWSWNAMRLAMVTNPIGLAAVGLVTAAALIYQHWEPIKGFFTGLFNTIRETVSGSIDWIMGKIQTATVLIYQHWEPVKGFFTGLFTHIRETVSGSIDWILAKIQTVGAFWNKSKAFFGFGSPAPAPTASAPSPRPPPVARIATARGTVGSVNAPQTNTFNITQLPGQDSKALAREVMRLWEEKQGVRRRGAMFDHAMGY